VYYARHTAKHFFTASLANGMKERLYHVKAKDCKMQKISASPLLCHQKAEHRVSAKHNSTRIVAIRRVGSNMRFSCFRGPMRKMVLPIDAMFPKV
jgi:hypothetical protein